MSVRYFNWKLAIVLIIGLAVLCVGAFEVRQFRRANRADQGLELGNEAYEEGRWAEAATNLGRYLAVKQDDTSVLLKYAESQLNIRPAKRSYVQQAVGAYRTILRLDKRNSESAKKLTEIYLGIGSFGEAELIARKQIEGVPDGEIHRMLALALAGQRKFKEAAAELKIIVQEHPDQILAYEVLGQLAEQRLEDIGGAPETWFDQAVEKNQSSALAYIVRAGFYRRNENVSEALADLGKAEQLDMSDPLIRLRLAKELVDTGLLDRAEEHLSVVREDAGQDQDLWRTWAMLAFRSRSQEKMLKVAEAGLKELSSQPWDFMPLATELFVLSGKLEDANDCISKLHAMDVGPATVAFLRGLVAAEQGQLSQAVKHWRQSMESGNKSPRIQLALASAWARLGNTQSAIQQLRSVVSESPDYFEGRLALAKLLVRTGNWTEALDQAAAAMRLSPEDADASLLHIHAQIQLIRTSPSERGQVDIRTWRDMRKRLSGLEESGEATDKVKRMQFQLAMQQEKLADAEKLLAQLKQTGLAQTEVARAEAELLAAQGKEDLAILKLYAAIEDLPDDVELVNYVAILLDRQGDREKCEKIVKEALARVTDPVAQRRLGLLIARFYVSWEQKEKAYPVLVALAQKLPGDIPIKRWLLLCEQTMEDPEDAQRVVDEIKSLEGESGWQWRYEQARVWFAAEDFKDNYARTVSLLQENLAANPDDQASRVFLARSYEKAGALQLAISTYLEALNRTPDDLRVIIPAVAALYGAKEYGQAEQILNRVSRQKLSHPLLSELALQDHLRRGELDSASVVLQDILSNDPNNQNAYLSLALLKMQQNDFEESAELLNTLKEQDPNSLAVAAAQIQLSVRQGNPTEAMRLSDQAVDNLGNAFAYILRARTHATSGRAEKAWEDLEHAASIEADNVDVWIARSDFNRAAGRQVEAIADIRRARSLVPDDLDIQKRAILLFLASRENGIQGEGKSLLEEALESNPEDVTLRLYKARSMLIEGTAPAIESAEQILREIADDRPETSQAWVLLGEIAIKQGQADKAMNAALGGLAYRPTDKTLLLLKARAEAARSPVLAVPTLESLHNMDMNDVGAAMLLANTYMKVGESKKALTLLKRQLTTSNASNRRRYQIALAVATYKNGNRQRAENEFDSLLSAEPNDPTPLLELVQLLKDDRLWSSVNQKVLNWRREHLEDTDTAVAIARGLQSVGDAQAKKVAEDILRTILRDDSGCTQAMAALAILLQTTARTSESAILYERLLGLEPDNVIAINNLAWIMSEEQGKHQEALELAQRGLKIAPDYFDLVDTRGVVYYRLGEFEKAAEDFSRCISSGPNTTPASVATRFYLARALTELGEKGQAITHLKQALELQDRIGGLSRADLLDAQRLLKQLQGGSRL